jgi:hypothetical protein
MLFSEFVGTISGPEVIDFVPPYLPAHFSNLVHPLLISLLNGPKARIISSLCID